MQKYKFEHKDMTFSKNGGLDELIALDRYAIQSYDDYKIGDTVVFTFFNEAKGIDEKRIGEIVKKHNDDSFEVKDRLGDSHNLNKESMHKPLETEPYQLWERWAKGGASKEKTEELKEWFENELRWLFDGYRYSMGGRVQLMLGQEHVTEKKAELTAFNCFSGDTIVQTKDGAKEIKDLQGKIEVLSQDGVYREAFFKDYGKQELFEITLANGEKIKATAGHEWIVPRQNKRVKTVDLEGRTIYMVNKKPTFNEKEVNDGIIHGIVYGDGSSQKRRDGDKDYAHVLLFGEKKYLSKYFVNYHKKEHYNGDYMGVYGLPPEFKNLPSDVSDSYWYGFVIGLISTDGHTDKRGHTMLHSSNLEDLQVIAKNLYKTGFGYTSLKMTRETSPYNGKRSPVYKISFAKKSIESNDLLNPKHKKNFSQSLQNAKRKPTIKVVKVEPLNKVETVYCCDEPETNSFVVGTGYLTGNCFVLDVPQAKSDAVKQFLEVLRVAKQEIDIQRRGGGTGVNISYINTVSGAGIDSNTINIIIPDWHKDYEELQERLELGKFDGILLNKEVDTDVNKYLKVEDSTDGLFLALKWMVTKSFSSKKYDNITLDFSNIRHRNAIVKGVNGRSSGAVSWAELFVLVAKLLQKDTVNNVEFAEIYSHITHLIEQGGSRRGALMLVNSSDNKNVEFFIERKKKLGYLSGANISVDFSDEFMEKVKEGRERESRIWDMAIEYAWKSAEPGTLFLERYNKESNSWYYNEIVSTNPCG